MAINLKYHIKYQIQVILITIFIVFDCNTFNKDNTEIKEINKSKEVSPAVLRVTYDSIWSPKAPFTLIESNNLYGNGISYKISYKDNQTLLNWVKISSTNQENKYNFPYLQTNSDSKVFYFNWQSKIITVVIQKSRTKIESSYCRWETIHKGYLIVIETEIENQKNIGTEVISQNFHTHVKESLILF